MPNRDRCIAESTHVTRVARPALPEPEGEGAGGEGAPAHLSGERQGTRAELGKEPLRRSMVALQCSRAAAGCTAALLHNVRPARPLQGIDPPRPLSEAVGLTWRAVATADNAGRYCPASRVKPRGKSLEIPHGDMAATVSTVLPRLTRENAPNRVQPPG